MTIGVALVVVEIWAPTSLFDGKSPIRQFLHAFAIAFPCASLLISCSMAFSLARLNELRNLLISLPALPTPPPSATEEQMSSPSAHPRKAKDDALTRMQPPLSTTPDVEEPADKHTPHLPLDLSSPSTAGWLHRVGLFEFASKPWPDYDQFDSATEVLSLLNNMEGDQFAGASITPQLISLVFGLPHVAIAPIDQLSNHACHEG